MKKFNYTMNHKADEAYMAKMCHEGWAATKLVEGIWTFEPCQPDQYTFRVCYLRGKSNAEKFTIISCLLEDPPTEVDKKTVPVVSFFSHPSSFPLPPHLSRHQTGQPLPVQKAACPVEYHGSGQGTQGREKHNARHA